MSAGWTARIVNPPAASSAFVTSPLSPCCTTPTMTGSPALDRNAIPRAQVMMIGNAKTQNTASGSRKNSRKRDLVSSMRGWLALITLLISQMPACQGDEHVLESDAMGREKAQRGLSCTQRVQERGHRAVELGRAERDGSILVPDGPHSRQGAELVVVRQRLSVRQRELNHVLGAERGHQRGRCAERNQAAVIHDANAVAQCVRLVHVVRGDQDRAA